MHYGPDHFHEKPTRRNVDNLLFHVKPPQPDDTPWEELREPALREVLKAVSIQTGISTIELMSGRRWGAGVRARFIYYHVARACTRKSLPRIAMECGGRHHATIMNGLHRARQRWAEISADVAAVENRLKAMCRPKEGH